MTLGAEKGSRKLKAAMTALWMTFAMAVLMLAAVWHANALKETIGSIVTLWLTGSGAVLAIFTAGNTTVHLAKRDPE